MTDKTCEICKGEGWVCEEHPGIPYEGPERCGCCGAGMHCVCNSEIELIGDLVVIAAVDPEKVKNWQH